MDLLSKTENLKIHYYFNDQSHSMDAFIRNAMEKEFLDFLIEVGKTLNQQIKIESQVREEGGLKEFWQIAVLGGLCFLQPAINNIVEFHFTGGAEKIQGIKLDNKSKEFDIKLKEEELKKSKISTQKEELELKALMEEYAQKIEQNRTLKRKTSNFYKKAENYSKLEKIGFKTNETQEEIIVYRSNFKSFILKTKQDVEVVEDAKIELISPVLKEGKYKWRGLYENQKIDFSMGDSGFKKDVINQQYNFSNGTLLICELEILKTFDDEGEEVKRSYSVKKVYETKQLDKTIITKSGEKRKRKLKEDSQPTLFDFNQD